MNAPETKLAADFAAANRDQWLKLVDKAIKGAEFEKKLVSKTADGIRIEPIYVRADALASANAAVPGFAPYTRSAHEAVTGLGWEIRQAIAPSDPSEANAQILAELEGGTNGIVLEIEAPGQAGCKITSAADLATALRGMRVDLAPIELKAGLAAPTVAKQLLDALPNIGIPVSEAHVFLGLDPIGTLARFGTLNASLDAALAEAITLAKSARAQGANIRPLKVDAAIYHEAGATDAVELAAMAATLVAYLRAFEAQGITPAEALPQIAFGFASDAEEFATVAKLRAARRIIWRIADASGAPDAAKSMHLSVTTSRRMMAKRDPWTNMLRTTLAAAGAAVGGADAITVLPFTAALGRPDAFTRRAARNIQIVLQEESNLGRVVDPMGGSWYIEKLTEDLANLAWSFFQEIEAEGGIAAALAKGFMQDRIATDAAARARAIATNRQELTGVSAFPILGDDGVTYESLTNVPAITGALQVRPLPAVRLGEAFEALRDTADVYTAKTGTMPQVFLASIGEVIDHTVRSTWIKNYLAAGGINAITTDGFKNATEAATAFKASGVTAACICSSDVLNAEHAEATAIALKASGAKLVLMAGRPGEREAALRAAGVDQFIAAGADAVATLKGLHSSLGVTT